jgi:hypothetical protein
LLPHEALPVRRSTPNTPKKTSALRRDALKQVLGLRATIQWSNEYAAKMEDIEFKHYTTPGTGPHFAENAVKEVASKAEDYFRQTGAL